MSAAIQGLRRRWYQWLVIGAGVLLGLVALALAVGFFMANRNANNLGRVALGDVLTERPASLDDAPINILLMAYASESSLSTADALRAPDLDAQRRAQSVMIVRLDANAETAMVLSVPPLTMGSTGVAIGEAATLGGARAAVQAISETLGVDIHHYAEMTVDDIAVLVDAVDGVSVSVPFAMRDQVSQFVVNTQGCVTFDGESARRYLAAHAMEGQINGAWTAIDTEPGRTPIDRERDLLAALVREVPDGLANSLGSWRFWSATADVAVVDDSLRRRDLTDLTSRFQDYQRRNLYVFSLPVSSDGQATPLLDSAVARDVLGVFRSSDSTGLARAVESAVRPGMTGLRSLTCR